MLQEECHCNSTDLHSLESWGPFELFIWIQLLMGSRVVMEGKIREGRKPNLTQRILQTFLEVTVITIGLAKSRVTSIQREIINVWD